MSHALDYTKAPSRKRLLRRASLAFIFLLTVFVAVRYGPTVAKRSWLLYTQSRCAKFSLPPRTLVYAEQLDPADPLFSDPLYQRLPPEFRGRWRALRKNPACWNDYYPSIFRFPFTHRGIITLDDRDRLLFLHERTASTGDRALIWIGLVPSTAIHPPDDPDMESSSTTSSSSAETSGPVVSRTTHASSSNFNTTALTPALILPQVPNSAAPSRSSSASLTPPTTPSSSSTGNPTAPPTA